jgi:hypothetical protein
MKKAPVLSENRGFFVRQAKPIFRNSAVIFVSLVVLAETQLWKIFSHLQPLF